MPGAQLFHLHIPKTAGSSLRSAFHHRGHRVLPIDPDFVFDATLHAEIDLFSGHAGFRTVETAPNLRAKVVTLLRDPYDRVFSYYFHLRRLHEEGRESSHRVELAAKYDLNGFLSIKDHPDLLGDLYNAMTWQLVDDARLFARARFRREQPALGDSDLVECAKANLSSCLAVGFQTRMERFAERLKQTTGFDLPVRRDNANPSRTLFAEIDADTRRRARPWIEMDVEIYDWALARFGRL